MLRRARRRGLRAAALRVPVVDVEGLIGLKLQARTPTQPIVGGQVAAQSTIRPFRPVRDLDEFLEFLTRIEELYGPVRRSPRPAIGVHFRL